VIKRILVPLDGSQLAEAVLPFVEDLALRLQAEVHFVQAVALHPPAVLMETAEGLASAEILYEELEAEAKTASQRLTRISAEWKDKGITATGEVVRGEAALSIIRYAQSQKADLIAMSTHGRSGLSQLIFGSVAEKVVREAGRPVMVVRPREVDAKSE
jgi:nucleotide-binding universal stress UspA family protein